jgi:hypothetical protein
MKKLLVVLMVLSMATMANAGLTINVNGVNPADSDISLLPSQTVAISVEGDGQNNPYTDYFLINTVTGNATMTGVNLVWPGVPSSAQYAGAADLAMLQGLGYNTTNTIWMSLNDGGGLPIGGTIINDVTLHCDIAPNDVLLSLISLTWVQTGEDEEGMPLYGAEIVTFDTQVIHQIIPEPITMALLGIGGLFLRRRK